MGLRKHSKEPLGYSVDFEAWIQMGGAHCGHQSLGDGGAKLKPPIPSCHSISEETSPPREMADYRSMA